MFKRFLAFLKESPFIEGMGRIFDFTGIMERGIAPAMTDAELLKADWNKVMGDFKHFIILVEEKGDGGKRDTQQKSSAA
jgi:hypothetical protein